MLCLSTNNLRTGRGVVLWVILRPDLFWHRPLFSLRLNQQHCNNPLMSFLVLCGSHIQRYAKRKLTVRIGLGAVEMCKDEKILDVSFLISVAWLFSGVLHRLGFRCVGNLRAKVSVSTGKKRQKNIFRFMDKTVKKVIYCLVAAIIPSLWWWLARLPWETHTSKKAKVSYLRVHLHGL